MIIYDTIQYVLPRINGLDSLDLLPVTDPGGRPILHFTLYGSHTNDLISDHLCAIEQN